MESKEAIQWLKAIETKYIHGGDEEYDLKRKEAIHKAIYALEKCVEKKPTHEATLYRALTCPSCKNVIDRFEEFVPGQKIRIRYRCCHFCWQLLDWSED